MSSNDLYSEDNLIETVVQQKVCQMQGPATIGGVGWMIRAAAS